MPGALPPTVNMHIVGHCNFGCQYCYARFVKAKTLLPLDAAKDILRQLREHGAGRITFAGGEPTLHPDLIPMLRTCCGLGLVTSLVTNASLLDRAACRQLFPWLRWLVISCDSHDALTNRAMGRAPKKLGAVDQPVRVEQVAGWVREWNAARVERDQVQLKINVVVTSINVHEDPSAWLASLGPRRIKLLQCCIVPGENDDAEALRCDGADFAEYARRVARLEGSGVRVLAESSDDLLDSYAMVDPRGAFRQARAGGYVESAPIQEVGVAVAWQQVGGCDLDRFRSRGGEYDAGSPSGGILQPIVALEGLDGSGKSTIAQALAERMGAKLVLSPPVALRDERAAADGLPRDERRSWYWRANAIAMREATDLVFGGHPVVMDRCFMTTAVYGAAEQGSVASRSDLPSRTDWPDAVFFLSLEEDERRRRLGGRATRLTDEERRLDQDAAFRQRVVAGYRALGARVVDASGSPAQVAAEVERMFGAARRISERRA